MALWRAQFFFIFSAQIFPLKGALSAAALLGAGPSIVAIAIATTTLAPDYRIFPMINGGIPLWVLTIFFIAIEFATIGSFSMPYAIAHIAAAAIGFIFYKTITPRKRLGRMDVWLCCLVQ